MSEEEHQKNIEQIPMPTEDEEVTPLLGKRHVPEDAATEEQIRDGEDDGANEAEVDNEDDAATAHEDAVQFQKSGVDPLWLCLRGVERFDQERNVLKTIQRLLGSVEPLNITKINKPKKKNLAFIQFSSKAFRDSFLEKLSSVKQKKQKRVKPMPAFLGDRNLSSGVSFDILEKQNNSFHQQQQRESQIQTRVATAEDIAKELDTPLEERVCPLWKTPYEEQVAMKKSDFKAIIKNIQKKAVDQLRPDEQCASWMRAEPTITEFLECDDESVRFNYRNKTELTIGLNHLGEPKVGYNRTNFEKGFAFIDDAGKNAIASQESIVLAYKLEEFIRTLPDLAVYDRFVHKGFWRYFVIRQSFRTKQILLNIVVKSSSATEEQLADIKLKLVHIFSKEQLPENFGYEVVSLGLQPYDQPSDSIPQDGQIEILHGTSTYQEVILGKTFNVSANAFLQVHTPQCERLYNLIGSLAGQLDENTVFLDICSGIGTIGICLATAAKEVIGIEMVPTACNDAKGNVDLNSITNYQVVCSKVEDVINGIVAPLAGKCKIIGVVDPPRPGLHGNVVKALRTCRGLDSLIYVACNPSAVTDNLLALCMPESKRRRAPGFHIVKYFGCDLFPQTKHFEAVFYLERYPKAVETSSSSPIEEVVLQTLPANVSETISSIPVPI